MAGWSPGEIRKSGVERSRWGERRWGVGIREQSWGGTTQTQPAAIAEPGFQPRP